MSSADDNSKPRPGVTPVYIKHPDLGVGDEDIEEIELSRVVLKKIKVTDFRGAQRIGGLWRVYVLTEEARYELYTNGINFRGTSVEVYDRNPLQRSNPRDTPEPPRTRVVIHNLPLVVENEEVQKLLLSLGIPEDKMLPVEFERMKDENNRPTSFLNGSRSALVESEFLQSSPLPRNSLCCNFRVRIWHYGQPKETEEIKETRQPPKCHNCFQELKVTRFASVETTQRARFATYRDTSLVANYAHTTKRMMP